MVFCLRDLARSHWEPRRARRQSKKLLNFWEKHLLSNLLNGVKKSVSQARTTQKISDPKALYSTIHQTVRRESRRDWGNTVMSFHAMERTSLSIVRKQKRCWSSWLLTMACTIVDIERIFSTRSSMWWAAIQALTRISTRWLALITPVPSSLRASPIQLKDKWTLSWRKKSSLTCLIMSEVGSRTQKFKFKAIWPRRQLWERSKWRTELKEFSIKL